MISDYLDMRGRCGPVSFLVSFLAIAVGSVLAFELIHAWLHTNHHLTGLIVFLGIIIGATGYSVLLTQAIRRLHDMNWHGIYAMLMVFPALAVAVVAGFGESMTWFARGVIVLAGLAVLAPLVAISTQRPVSTEAVAH